MLKDWGPDLSEISLTEKGKKKKISDDDQHSV